MTRATVLTGVAVFLGFVVGFGIGQKSRVAAQSNVSAELKDGKVIVVADVATAVKTGTADFISSLIN